MKRARGVSDETSAGPRAVCIIKRGYAVEEISMCRVYTKYPFLHSSIILDDEHTPNRSSSITTPYSSFPSTTSSISPSYTRNS